MKYRAKSALSAFVMPLLCLSSGVFANDWRQGDAVASTSTAFQDSGEKSRALKISTSASESISAAAVAEKPLVDTEVLGNNYPSNNYPSNSEKPSSSTDGEPAPLTEAISEAEEQQRQAEKRKSKLLQQALLKIYRSNLLKKTYQHVEYPDSSIEKNEQGDVILLLTILRNGKVKQIDYATKSRSSALNVAARTAVKRARPFDPAPAALEGESFEITMPIRFRLTE